MSDWNRVAYDGNHLACYEWQEVTCRFCGGTGVVEVTKEQLRGNIFTRLWNLTWRKILAVYRAWKKNGHKIECPDCGGRGSWEEWR